jgi:putative inorganic carbon (hco3(-)) transporter
MQFAELVGRWEPPVVVGVAVSLWYPRPATLFVAAALPALWLARRAATGRFSVKTPFDGWAVLMLALLPVSLTRVHDWSAASRALGLVTGLSLLYAVANSAASRTAVLRSACAFAVLGGVGVALGGAATLAGPLATPGGSAVLGLPHGGLNPNEVGGFLTLTLPLAMAFALHRVLAKGLQSGSRLERWVRPVAAAAALLQTAVVFAGQSRAALFGVLASIVCLVVENVAAVRGARWRRWLGGGLVAAVALSPVFALAVVSGAGSRGGSLEYATGDAWIAHRLDIWARGLYVLAGASLTGAGPGQFALMQGPPALPHGPPPGAAIPHAHNLALQAALDFGVPAALTIGALVWCAFPALDGAQRLEDLERLARALNASMTGFLVYGITDAVAVGARGGLGLWWVLGLVVGCWGLGQGTAGSRRGGRPLAGATLGSVVLLCLVLQSPLGEDVRAAARGAVAPAIQGYEPAAVGARAVEAALGGRAVGAARVLRHDPPGWLIEVAVMELEGGRMTPYLVVVGPERETRLEDGNTLVARGVERVPATEDEFNDYKRRWDFGPR